MAHTVTRHRKPLLLLLPLLAAALLATTWSATRVQGAASTTELKIVSKRAFITLPDVPTLGLTFVVGGSLSDTSGKPIGDGFSHCTLAKAEPDGLTGVCGNVFRLANGDLHFESVRKYPTTLAGEWQTATIAITGGTGAYRLARGDGTATLTDAATHTHTWTFEID
jgi:hypothetical protein